MKRKRLISTAAIPAAVMLALLIFWPREPSFEGKPLSRWIQEMSGNRQVEERDKAKEVVRKLGSNSTSILFRWLKEGSGPSFRERVDAAKEEFLFWLMRHKVIENRGVTSGPYALSHHALALRALPNLDPEAKRVLTAKLIPLLAEKDRENSVSELAGTAFLALQSLSPESIEPLISSLTNRIDDVAWMLAAGTLSEIGPDAKTAIPQLKPRLHDKDFKVQLSAANAIGKLGGDPDTFIPVVMQALSQATADSWDFILELLTEYKEHAKPAVPILLQKLNAIPKSNNPEQLMHRQQIIDALQQIDPKAAKPFIETK